LEGSEGRILIIGWQLSPPLPLQVAYPSPTPPLRGRGGVGEGRQLGGVRGGGGGEAI